MNTSRRAWSGLLAATLLCAGGGCRKYQRAEVEGTVTLEGKPLCGVRVFFYPDTEGEMPSYAFATTDAAGHYSLKLVNGKPGAVVGMNRVVVNWPPPERSNMDPPPPPPPRPAIPARYTVAMDTREIQEVKPGVRQTIDIDLKLE